MTAWVAQAICSVLVVVLSLRWGGSPVVAVAYVLVLSTVAGQIVLLFLGSRSFVTADSAGVTVARWRRSEQVPWEDLDGVHGRADRLDTDLDLVRTDGTRVRLPPSFPKALLLHWREELAR